MKILLHRALREVQTTASPTQEVDQDGHCSMHIRRNRLLHREKAVVFHLFRATPSIRERLIDHPLGSPANTRTLPRQAVRSVLTSTNIRTMGLKPDQQGFLRMLTMGWRD